MVNIENTNLGHQILELRASNWLSQQICQLVLSFDMNQTDQPRIHLFSNEITVNFNVRGALMEGGIGREVDC